jgi:hypothetical protein
MAYLWYSLWSFVIFLQIWNAWANKNLATLLLSIYWLRKWKTASAEVFRVPQVNQIKAEIYFCPPMALHFYMQIYICKKAFQYFSPGSFVRWYRIQGCQMVYFQTKNPNLGKFGRVLH